MKRTWRPPAVKTVAITAPNLFDCTRPGEVACEEGGCGPPGC